MTLTPQFKLNQLIKDLGLKPKEVTEILKEKGIEAKAQKTLEPAEFDILFEALTKKYQITDIDSYIKGVTYIPSQKVKPAEAKKVQKAAADAPTPEAGKTQSDKKTESAEAVAAAKAPSTPSEQPKAAQMADVKTEKGSAQEPKAVAQELKPAPQEQKMAAQEPKTAVQEPKAAAEEQIPEAKAAAQKSRAAVQDAREDKTQTKKEEPRSTPQQNAQSTQRPAAQPAEHKAAPQNEQRPAAQQNPQRAAVQTQQSGQHQPAQGSQRPAAQTGGQQSAQAGGQRQQNQPQHGAQRQGAQQHGQQRPATQHGGQSAQTGGQRLQSQPQHGAQRQGGQQNQPRRDGGYGRESQQGAPKEKFQPQPIVRGATPKKDGQSGPRIVDTRGTANVDLDKYDERLDNIVPENVRDLRGGSEKVKRNRGAQSQQAAPKNVRAAQKKTVPIKKQPVHVSIPDEISVSELASRLKVTAAEVVKRLLMMGMFVTVNQYIDFDTAYLVADELGAIVTREVVQTIEEKLFDENEDRPEDLVERAPVVCVMGHVDHGKTSLLDAIRHTNVTSGEAGGITQHIGAYRVKVKGKEITFLDTPGHEAFTAMRARGAQSTDIAILVVAADDGVMPQTVEAINHAKAAGVDIVVAINKMDKPTANPDNVLQELTKYELVPEAWGGDVICVPVSALTGKGIDDLLENVLLVAEMKELKANPKRRAKGVVIEAKLDKGRGPVATVLVQNGTLRIGDIVIAGTAVGRVRAMTDHRGKPLKTAGPSVPVEIMGLAEIPSAGDEFNAVEDEKMARTLAEQRKSQAKEEGFKANARANLNDLFSQISEGVKVLNIIVKADVHGSAEAVKAALEKLSNEEVKVKVIHSAAGGITEGDVMFAAASNAIIVGFNVRPDKAALDSAERQGVDIRTYRIIYECIDEVSAAMKGMLAPKFKEVILGHAEVRQTIHVPNVGTVAGSYVQDGKITRSASLRVLRGGVVIFEDKIASLRRFKDDVREVMAGYECGIALEKFNDLKVGDIFEAYAMEEIQA